MDALASPLSPCRPAQVRHSESSFCSSFIRLSHWEQEKILGSTMYPPLYTCSVTCKRLVSLSTTRVCTLGCPKAVSDDSKGIPQGHLCSSLCHMAAALWNILSNRNGFHSCLWVAFCPGRTLLLHFVQEELGPQGPVGYSVRTACSLGILLCPFCQDCKVAIG